MTRIPARPIAALCLLVALLAGAASAAGVFMRGDGSTAVVTSELGEQFPMALTGVYRNNSQRMVAEGVGWDIFTLFVAVPAMLCALPLLLRGSLRGRLFALGLLGYFFYQYMMYAMTWAFGPLFLLFIAVYAASLAGIVWVCWTLRLSEIADELAPRLPARGMAIFSLLMGVALKLMWFGRIGAALTGPQPAPLLGQTTLVVQAMDLGLIVPLSVWTGIAAWRRTPVGVLLSSVLVVKGAAMALAICAMLLSAWFVEGKLEVPPLILFGAAALAAIWMGARMYSRGAAPGGVAIG